MSAIPPTAPSNLSSVGASLLTTGTGPRATAAAAATQTGKISTYQTAFRNLQQYDTRELLYASFLSPEDSLANGNAILQQAAALLAAPGTPATPPASTPPSAPTQLRSVSAILAESDAAAQKTLAAYAKAPAGSSILDFQA